MIRRDAWPLVALAALFLGPLVIALALYAGRDLYGGFDLLPNPDRELFDEPVQIPATSLHLADGTRSAADWARSRWSMIYARMPACAGQCDAPLARLGQVYQALGSGRDRVRLVILAPAGGYADEIVADILIGDVRAPSNAILVELLGPERLDAGRVFVADPLGNIVLSYPADADQGRLLNDLERLLEVSRIG